MHNDTFVNDWLRLLERNEMHNDNFVDGWLHLLERSEKQASLTLIESGLVPRTITSNSEGAAVCLPLPIIYRLYINSPFYTVFTMTSGTLVRHQPYKIQSTFIALMVMLL